jgi:hypothetical protein
MKTFRNINEAFLAKTIATAKERIVYVAPGITSRVADAIGMTIANNRNIHVVIVLDVDSEVCRLGYGDLAGLETIQRIVAEQQITLDHQAGMRVGLLIVDEQTIIYSPTPLLIEAGSPTLKDEKPNGILLHGAKIEALEDACGASNDDENAAKRELGLDPVNADKIAILKRDLKENPPQDYNIARKVRVFNSALEYVELKVTGMRLSLRKAPIPKKLMGFGNDNELAKRWSNNYKLLDGSFSVKLTIKDISDFWANDKYPPNKFNNENYEDPNRPWKGSKWEDELKKEKWTDRDIEEVKKKILGMFTFTIKKQGVFILKNEKEKFDQTIAEFRNLCEKFTEFAKEQISLNLKKSKKDIIEYLIPAIQKNPPEDFHGDPNDKKSVEAYLDANLSKEKEFSPNYVFEPPEIELQYKALTYETISDSAFRNEVERALSLIGKRATIDPILKEFDAAPAIKGVPEFRGLFDT